MYTRYPRMSTPHERTFPKGSFRTAQTNIKVARSSTLLASLVTLGGMSIGFQIIQNTIKTLQTNMVTKERYHQTRVKAGQPLRLVGKSKRRRKLRELPRKNENERRIAESAKLTVTSNEKGISPQRAPGLIGERAQTGVVVTNIKGTSPRGILGAPNHPQRSIRPSTQIPRIWTIGRKR